MVTTGPRKSLVTILWTVVAGCQSVPGPVFVPAEPWNGKVYASDHAQAAIVRKQASEVIACTDEAFDGFICMSNVDFLALFIAMKECR